MYGVMPPAPAHESFSVERVDKHFFGGKATKKEITITFDPADGAPGIHLLLVIPHVHPNDPSSRAGFPVFVGPNFCGNHLLVADPSVALPTAWMPADCPGCVNHHATEAGRGSQAEVWAIEQSIDRGYAVATFYYGDVEPDHANAPDGLRAWLRHGAAQSEPKDTGAVAAWAWAISRAIDYLVTDQEIDARRIAATGHSRNGKAAALAAAFDERIALAVPLQAGCGGTAPSRGKIGESVKAINDRFPHWFNDEFKKFNDQPDRLPFDQNCLIALIAPRPVLLACAEEDTWSNPVGQFDMLRSADAVYRFLGGEGLAVKEMPATGNLTSGQLSYYIRPGKHSMTRADWKIFLDFADQEFARHAN